MQDLWVGLGLVVLLEGAIYALFPKQMIEAMRKIPATPVAVLRVMGLLGVMIGWFVIRMVRG